jgi:hypothetical protein
MELSDTLISSPETVPVMNAAPPVHVTLELEIVTVRDVLVPEREPNWIAAPLAALTDDPVNANELDWTVPDRAIAVRAAVVATDASLKVMPTDDTLPRTANADPTVIIDAPKSEKDDERIVAAAARAKKLPVPDTVTDELPKRETATLDTVPAQLMKLFPTEVIPSKFIIVLVAIEPSPKLFTARGDACTIVDATIDTCKLLFAPSRLKFDVPSCKIVAELIEMSSDEVEPLVGESIPTLVSEVLDDNRKVAEPLCPD